MLTQSALWPGVLGVESCEGSISHGIGPSTFQLVTVPQVAEPEAFGDLVFSDGENVITFRDCKLHLLTGRVDGKGQSYILEILDRRWRWQGFGAVDGRYNRTDSHGKLVPWTIRSPKELAEICLKEMGETGYEIDLPDGLSKKDGADLDRYLRLGENFKQTLANSPVVWDRSPPAEVLARMCEYFGRRVIYQPVADRVLIAKLGEGEDLPDLGSEVITPSIKVPEAPAGVGVAGTMRVQARFLLEAVGREWDDSYLPINDLSYAPRYGTPAVQISSMTFVGSGNPSSVVVNFTWNPLGGGPPKSTSVTISGTTAIADSWAALKAAIYANPDLAAIILPSFSGNVFQFTGLVVGLVFTVTVTYPGAGAGQFQLAVAQTARIGGGDWTTCPPPSFSAVLATERLSRLEAIMRARESVFRCYRIKAVDPSTGKPPLKIPYLSEELAGIKNLTVGFREITRRQRVILLPSRVAQVVPQARVASGTNKGALLPPGQTSGGILPEFYNGYSRDQQAVVYGSVSRFVGAVNWVPAAIGGGSPFNTAPTDRVYVDFSIDPVEQIITFSDYVFFNDFSGGGWIREPRLVLETGCLLCDEDTDQIMRYKWEKPLGGAAPMLWAIHEDAEVGIVGKYDDDHKLTGYETVNKEDADARAKYYLDAMTIPFQLSGGVTRQYPGILPIDPDGLIQQVTWSVGAAGPTTVASANSEHSPNVPDYPRRRQRENLPANQAARAANLVERAQSEKLFPRPGGSPK